MEKGTKNSTVHNCEKFSENPSSHSPHLANSSANSIARTNSSMSNNNNIISSTTAKMAASLLDIRERRNWLIHQLYIRQEYIECLSVIEAQLQECGGVCEYALYVKGLLARRKGELTESFNLFQSAMFINPQNPANRKQVAQALLLLGQHRAAIEAFHDAENTRMINGAEPDWGLQYSIGMCYMYLKEYRKAEDAFVTSISIQRHDCCIMQLGKTLVLQHDYERAIGLYEEALQTTPDNPDLLTTIGFLYLKTGKPGKAFHYIGKCLTLDASNPTATMAAASIMQENGDFTVALNKYRISIAKLPHSAHLWSNIGMCFFAQKNMHASVACLRKALALSPLDWRISYNMGIVFLHLKQYASAFHYLSRSTYLNGNYAMTFMHLGICLSLMNDVVNSCAAYGRALSIDQDPLIQLNYCITLLNCLKLPEAKKEFNKFMQLWESLSEKRQKELGLVFPRTIDILNTRLNSTTTTNNNNNNKNNTNNENVKNNKSSSCSSTSSSIEGGNNNNNKMEDEVLDDKVEATRHRDYEKEEKQEEEKKDGEEKGGREEMSESI